MREPESRFPCGPDIFRMAPCFVSLLDLDGHRPVELGDCPDGAGCPRSALKPSESDVGAG